MYSKALLQDCEMKAAIGQSPFTTLIRLASLYNSVLVLFRVISKNGVIIIIVCIVNEV